MENLLDVIIIGSGPAGLTAGIYAVRAELRVLVIEKNPMSGGQIINTYEVDNYPGIPGISGFELADKFRKHCDRLGVTFTEGDVAGFDLEGEVKKVTLDNGEIYYAKTVIIATGSVCRKLDVPGEEKLAGMGVSYCATCDGAFFRNKKVAVVGGGDVALEDAIFLARLCQKVYVVHRRNEFRGAKSISSKLLSLENVEVLWDSVVEQIDGNDFVESIEVRSLNDHQKQKLEVEGVFIAVGNVPSSSIYQSFLVTDDSGYIVADESCETNIPGVFAAGDIRTKQLKQVITAASDGANAITAVEKYLNKL